MLKLGVYETFGGGVNIPGKTMAERLANLEAWGFQGIQLPRSTIVKDPSTVKDILQPIADSKIRLCVYGGTDGFLAADRETRRAAIEATKQGLRWAASLGAIGTVVVPGRGARPAIEPPEPPRTIADLEREILIEELAELARTAEAVGVPLILEPLNRYEAHLINSVVQGAEICRAVGSPAIKVMADFFHMNIEEADLGKAIEEAGDCIAYVHLADSNRCQPGAGHLDFLPALSALKRIGYDGYMTFECKILGEDKGKALVETARYIRELWARA